MDIDAIFNAGGVNIVNPAYSKYKKNTQPKFITVSDLDRATDGSTSHLADISYTTAANEMQGIIGTEEEAKKYLKYGIVNTRFDPNLDKQLADAQGFGEKLWNAVTQTVWSEIVLGTLQGFTDLFDVITGAAFSSDNDYQNAASKYLEEARENFKNNNPIYVDPDKSTMLEGGYSDSGWWLSNLPSIASSLTLLIPGAGVAKGVSMLGKLSRLNKAIGYGRKALTGARKIKNLEDASKLSKFGKWANKQSTITAANKMFENGLTATAMRTLENYQEARQTYNDMYNEASKSLSDMSDDDYNIFVNKYKDELEDTNTNDRDAVARKIAHNSATKTFTIDYGNLLFDVAQVYALRNPLKLTKNLRTTAKVRKAERQARKYAGKSAEDIAKLEAAEKFGIKAKNYINDHVGALGVFGAESSEGIEEAVNYIAQQEGMHYGRTMIDLENNPDISFNKRLSSYMASPELYDAAFWGVLGGVMFQNVGSGINRIKNAITGKIAEYKNTNDKTKEGTDIDWKDRFETAENKRRVSEINARAQSYNTLADRLSAIEDGKDPFNVDSNDPTKQASLSGDEAKQVARDRAIDEYIVSMTFRAIENGNYDLLKSYLQDENVRKALAEKGIIDSETQSTESLIQRMNEVEQIYNDNIIALDGMSRGVDIPFEYIQIIAKDNALAQLQIQRLDEQLQNYEVSAENNKRRFGANLDQSIDYKSAVELAVTTRRLAELRARKKAILEDKTYAKSIDGQNALRDIDNEIKSINENLFNDTWGNGQDASMSSKLAKLIWSNVYSTKGKYDKNGKFNEDKEAVEYIGALNAIAAKDMKALQELTGINFKTTDEDILSLFGEDGKSGSYNILSSDLNIAFDLKKGIDKAAPNLSSDYQNIAAIKLAKLQQQATIANTTQTINTRVNELHNSMKKARRKAIELSEKDIFDLATKYGNEAIEAYIFENEDISDISESDKKKLDAALEVLNLTADSNRILGENLKQILFMKSLNDISEQAVENEKNVKNQNTNSATKSSEVSNPLTQTQTSEIGPSEGQNQASPVNNKQAEQKKEKLSISPNIDGEIDVDTNIGEKDNHYDYIEDENGILTLSISGNNSVPENLITNSSIYEGYDKNAETSGAKRTIVFHPKITRDENGKYSVVEKGKIEYTTEQSTKQTKENNEASQESSKNNPSTGDVDVQTARSNRDDNSFKVETSDDFVPETDDNPNIDKTVAPVPVTEEYIESIENSIMDEANSLSASRDKSIDANIALDNIKQQLKEKHKNDENSEVVDSAINRAIKILRARYTRKGLIKSAAEVLSSSVTEMPNGKYDFSQEYKNAVIKMIEDYCRENGIREINGKRYINLEETLRRINTLFEENMADMMFGALNAYLKTKESKDKFVVMDDTTNSEEFLRNVKKTAKQRAEEHIGNISGENNRVSIDRLFENPSEEFLKTFNSLNKGDKLTLKVVNSEIQLSKDNVVVGILPKPLVNQSSGAFYMYNKGWRTEVYKENGRVYCNLESLFESILNEDNEQSQQINDTITELNANENLTKEQKDKLIEKVYDILANNFNILEYNIISKSASKQEVVEHICNLWRYFSGIAETPGEKRAFIADSLNSWFTKLYNEYEYINSLANSLINTDNIDVTISNITSGEVIRIIDTDTIGNNYDKFTQSNQAFANPKEITLGIVNPKNKGMLDTVDGRVIQHDRLGTSGSPTIIIPNKNGVDNYIIGTSIKFNDNNLTGDGKAIMSAIKQELNYQVEKHIKEGNYQDLFDFLHELFYNTNKEGSIRGLKPNTSLLYGVVFGKQAKKENGFYISTVDRNKQGNSITLNIKDIDGEKKFSYKRKGEEEYTQADLANAEDITIFKEILNNIMNEAMFNISVNYIGFDAHGYDLKGFGTGSPDGKFNIYIPNSENPSQAFNKTYDSFQDAVISGGLIRVNTKVENGSNYRRKGKNQGANQIMEVSIKDNTSSPVKVNESSSSDASINTNSNVENILKDDKIDNKANAILDDVLTKEELKSLNDLHLLPENIIFDENFNVQDENGNWAGDNARAYLNEGTTVVGKRWVQMFNEEGEFSGDKPGVQKLQAVRKLIHEQLHHKLAQRGKKQYLAKIKAIYQEFRESLKNANEEDKKNITKYNLLTSVIDNLRDNEYYKNKIENLSDDEIIDYIFNTPQLYSLKGIILEEFLVESLTSEELVDYLNRTESKVDKKKLSNNLWQRILKLLNNIFGWNIKEGSLREKELYALQGTLKTVRKAFDSVTKTTKEIQPISSNLTKNDISEEKTEVKANENIISDDEIDYAFDDMFNDDTNTRGSIITETLTKYSSVSEFTAKLPIEQQAEFIASVNAGEISTACR